MFIIFKYLIKVPYRTHSKIISFYWSSLLYVCSLQYFPSDLLRLYLDGFSYLLNYVKISVSFITIQNFEIRIFPNMKLKTDLLKPILVLTRTKNVLIGKNPQVLLFFFFVKLSKLKHCISILNIIIPSKLLTSYFHTQIA